MKSKSVKSIGNKKMNEMSNHTRFSGTAAGVAQAARIALNLIFHG
jgi:hypothetical protein